MLKRNCVQCGKEFDFDPGNGIGKFCSRSCYDTYRLDHPDVVGHKYGKYIACEQCGKVVYKAPSSLREHNYCSRTCANQKHSQYLAEHPELQRKPGGIDKVCEYCGKAYVVKAYRAEHSRFCSNACKYADRNNKTGIRCSGKDITGENNPNYKNGANKATASYMARELYGNACMICGFDVSVNVHHIVPRAEGGKNIPDNLVILCPNHHAMAHKGIISRDDLKALARSASSQLQDRQHP